MATTIDPNDSFDAAVKAVLDWEGGYVNDPADPGGETNFGISRRSYPTTDIEHLTVDQAIAIYRRDFWTPLRCSEMPAPIAAKVFDMAVNMGLQTAAKLLQRALNHLCINGPLAIDGKIGPLTILAAKTASTNRLLAALRTEARNHYIELATETPSLRQYLRGWLRRANA